MKLEITFGRDVDDDFALDITLTIGNRQYCLGLFAMYIVELQPESPPYVFTDQPDLTGTSMKDMGWSPSSKTNLRPEEPFEH